MVFCEEGNKIHLFYYDYFLPALFSIGLISMLPSLFLYVRAYIKNHLNSSPLLFYVGIAFYVVLSIYFVNIIIQHTSSCHNEIIFSVTQIIANYLYLTQGLLIIGFFLIKLITIFDQTLYTVAKLTTIIYTAFLTVDMVLAVCGISFVFFLPQLTAIGFTLQAIAWLIYLLMVIALNVSFAHKLWKVSVSKDEKLISVIIKSAVLCFSSTWMTLLWMVFFFMRGAADSSHFVFVSILMLFCDLYSNFLSLVLSFTYFEKWYTRVCGCCHRQLSRCCGVERMQRDLEMMEQVVASTSPAGANEVSV